MHLSLMGSLKWLNNKEFNKLPKTLEYVLNNKPKPFLFNLEGKDHSDEILRIYKKTSGKTIKNWKHSIANGEHSLVVDAKRKEKLDKLYKVPFEQSWIYKTVKDNKIKNKISESNNIVLVGCGLYPYSL